MKYLKILPLLLLPLFAAAQPLGTWPVQYGDTPPTHTPSGSGTRIYLNISTNELYNWNPAPVSSWVKYPKGFDQISGCAAPGYTPTARQSVFAVNSCTVLQNGRGPELYQYTGSQWVCLNCYPAYTAGTGIGISSGVVTNTAPDQVISISGVGITPSGTYPNFTLTAADQSATNELNTSVYVDAGSLKIDDAGGTISVPLSQFRSGVYNAGTGISINSGTGAISNTGDLSTTNELNTSLSVSGGNVRLTDPGGTLTLPVTDVAPVQSVVAGAGINITGSGSAKTITNSAPNVTQTLSISGSDLTLSDGGGTVTLPGGSITWPLLAPAGSSEAPSYSFEDLPQTGIFLDKGLKIKAQIGNDLNLLTAENPEGDSPNIFISTGAATDGSSGSILITIGESINGTGGGFRENAGDGTTQGGGFALFAGNSSAGVGGNFDLTAGASGLGDGGNFNMTAGNSADANGGDINLTAGGGPTRDGRVVIASQGGLKNVAINTTARNALVGVDAGTTIFCTNATATDGSKGVLQTWNGSEWKNHW